jgi:hypothetical protein
MNWFVVSASPRQDQKPFLGMGVPDLDSGDGARRERRVPPRQADMCHAVSKSSFRHGAAHGNSRFRGFF